MRIGMKLILSSSVLIILAIVHGTATDENNCAAKRRDVIALLDSSESISDEDFENAKIALGLFLGFFKIAPNETRVALVGIGSRPLVDFKFSNNTNASEVNDAIQHHKKIGGQPMFAETLQLLLTDVMNDVRTNSEKIVLVISNGQNSGKLDPVDFATKIKEKNTTIFSLGIGAKPNESILQNISSDNSVLLLQNFATMDRIIKQLVNRICENPVEKEPCNLIQQDLVILFDSSNSINVDDYEIAKLFVRRFLSMLAINPVNSRVAMLSFSETVRLDFDFDLADSKKILQIVSNLKKFGSATGIGVVLRETLAQLKPKQRPGVPFNVILITDGLNTVFPNAVVQAALLKKAGANIVSVGVGKGINIDELRSISSNEKVLTSSSYDALLSNIKTVIKASTCDPGPEEFCNTKHNDLVILLDSSQSISYDDYEKAKLFIQRFLTFPEFGVKTRVSLLSFANEVRLDFDFNLTNQTKFMDIIKNLTKFGTATAIGMALRVTYRQIKPMQRPGVPFNVLLITDGENNMFPGPVNEANILKKNGASIITLGVGTGVNINELRAISSDEKVLTINSYSDLLINMKTIVKTVTCG